MKLYHKTSLYYLLFSVPILLLASFVCYYIITSEVRDSNNELLLKRKTQIERLINLNDSVSLNLITRTGEAEIIPLTNLSKPSQLFADTLIYDANEDEPAPNRLLVANVNTKFGAFQIRVWRSTIEFSELFEGILAAIFLILILLFVSLFFINSWVNRVLWKPFYTANEFISNFNFTANKTFQPAKTSIAEFSVLNKSVNTLIEKIMTDYNIQKQFAENASHEMQTPLAVINSKIDLLIQSENLTKKETELIVAIDDATAKLIRINKALLLLTKIENRQFGNAAVIHPDKIIDNVIEIYHDYIQSKNININKQLYANASLTMNPDLCFILISNLVQNAIRHNIQDGKIEITLTANQLTIANTGKPLNISASSIFNRFQKNESNAESIGLGLAIAKEIAVANDSSLDYSFQSDMHTFTLTFNQQ